MVSDSGLADARREERVLQLLRMINDLLAKHKETSKRFLNLTVPRVVAGMATYLIFFCSLFVNSY